MGRVGPLHEEMNSLWVHFFCCENKNACAIMNIYEIVEEIFWQVTDTDCILRDGWFLVTGW